MKSFTLSLATLCLLGKINAVMVNRKIEASECCGYCNKNYKQYQPYQPYVPYYPQQNNCGCGECAPEFEALNERLDGVLGEKIPEIKETQAENGAVTDQVLANQEANLGLSADISLKLDDVLLKIEEASETVGSIPEEDGACTVNININGACCEVEQECECDCEPIEPPGSVEPLPECSAIDNVLTAGNVFKFFQTYPLGRYACDNRFFLLSPTINTGEDIDSIHAMSPEGEFPEEELTQATAMVLNQDDIDMFLDFTYDPTITESIETIEGGQLKDVDGNCLGYTEIDNFTDRYGSSKTLLQVVPCLTLEDLDLEDTEQLELTKQLWSVEASDANEDLVYIRNICGDLVIKKTLEGSKVDADEIYTDQSECQLKNFKVEVVPKTECVSDHKFNVNDCLFSVDPVSL